MDLSETSRLKAGTSRRYNVAAAEQNAAGHHNPAFGPDGVVGDRTGGGQNQRPDGSVSGGSSDAFGLRRQLGVTGATSLIFGCIVGQTRFRFAMR